MAKQDTNYGKGSAGRKLVPVAWFDTGPWRLTVRDHSGPLGPTTVEAPQCVKPATGLVGPRPLGAADRLERARRNRRLSSGMISWAPPAVTSIPFEDD